jgi:uridine phosphorylase
LIAIEKVNVDNHARIVASSKWKNGTHHIYEMDYKGKRLAFSHPGIGSPLAAGLLEEAIAFGLP